MYNFSELKAFADDKIYVAKMTEPVFDRVENINPFPNHKF